MRKEELKRLWNKEKESYKTYEVGSGVQRFVKEVLQSEDVFALRKGLKSTPLENRKDEFLEEEQTKEQRKADIIIYISSDIIIPLEIEKYQNIEAGTKQLLNYQADLDKKYGILTDGFTWRFYNNNIFREFNLNQILNENELFLEFWKEYIKPELYYLLFFEPFGQLQLVKQEKLPVEENRQMFFEDITKLIKGFKNKLQIEGYFNGLDKKTKTKMAVEITYAYIIQFILYKTLVDNDFGKFGKEFENRVEKIHKFLKERRYEKILGIIDGISALISENIYRPFAKEQESINQKLLQLYRRLENKLSDVSAWLDIFVFIKKYNFANIENEIFGYIYENYLKELYTEEKKGQYFTDPAVVNFMLQQIGFTPEEIEKRYKTDKNTISLIDPACGSGTFLYSAVNQIIKAFGNHTEETSKQIEEIVNNNIFGLDIEEFPIYLAEMNILMRLLPLIITEKYNNPVDKKIKVFLTKDSIAEFTDTALRNTFNDIEVKGGQQSLNFEELDLGYESYVREKDDLKEMKKSLENVGDIRRRRFDYVIGNPPYVGYNECSKQKVLIFELMKQRKASLNNIYGINLHSIPYNQKKYAPKPNLYAFFIALGIALLKDNGKLCYIIPQTILTAGDLDVLRYHLAKFTTIEKIITFSGKMFIGRGLKQNKPVATSSLIFVLNRKMPSKDHQVEIINYIDPNDTIGEALQNILSGKVSKKIEKKKILQNKLFQNVASWNFIKQSKKFLDFYEAYKRNTDDILIYYDHILAEQKFGNRFYFDIGFVLNPKETSKAGNTNDFYELLDFKTFCDYSRFIPTTYYPKDKNSIKLTQNSQGYITLEQKYKIIWSIKNPDRFCFTNHPIIFYMGKASIICSNNKEEILYLLSLLNCPITKIILEAQLKSEQEKEYLIPIKAVKEFVRVPKITEDNQATKKEIVKSTEEMLALEENKLSDFVDFSKVMLQKFDRVSIEGNNLILEKDDAKIKLAIKENLGLIKKCLNEKYGKQLIDLETQKISLSELKYLPIIDYEKQQKIKNYIDDLVFALYFNIGLEKLGLNQAEKIKEKCSKNPYYRMINTHKLSKP
jgi:hypothetical protein